MAGVPGAVRAHLRREVLPLDQAPVEVLALYVGDCLACRRAMAGPTAFRRHPEGRPYLVAHKAEGLCRGCHDRTHGRPAEDRERRLSPAEVARLRRQVACVACGAVPHRHRQPRNEPRAATRADHGPGCHVGRIPEGVDPPWAQAMARDLLARDLAGRPRAGDDEDQRPA